MRKCPVSGKPCNKASCRTGCAMKKIGDKKPAKKTTSYGKRK